MNAVMPTAATAAPRARSVSLLSGAFALFNSLRIVAYLPTLLAIQASGHADQHSLFTWLIFAGANSTMALWLHEQNGRRTNRAVVVNAFNALMCGAIAASIAWWRWVPPAFSFASIL
ncbi:MAG: hypothetical protein KF788_09895 [Piscinibacter sp.]|nr:hypothetical protein [Piscinibacter sp.]